MSSQLESMTLGSAPLVRGRFAALGIGGVVWVALAAILVVLIANPLLHLLAISFSGPNGVGWTLQNYVTAFGSRRYLEAYGNSLLLGCCVAALCAVFGVPI